MVLVASLSAVVGDVGSHSELFVGRIPMSIRGAVRKRWGRATGQGSERPHFLPASFADVCSDFYGQPVAVAGAVLLVLALLGKNGNGGFVRGSCSGCAILELG